MTKRRRALPLGKTDWGIVTEGCKITARLEKAVPGGFPWWEDAEHGRGLWMVARHCAVVELITTGPCGCQTFAWVQRQLCTEKYVGLQGKNPQVVS